MKKPVLFGQEKLNISSLGDVALRLEKVAVSKSGIARVRKNFKYLKEQSEKRVIYGLNTGFGPMAHIYILKERQIELQYNLIRSHAMGLGKPLSVDQSRAVMAIRLQTLLQGHSAVCEEACALLAEFLNRNITPVIYSHGSVGASGDLVQLAHVAQALIGEGEVVYGGKTLPTREVFSKVLAKDGLVPLGIQLREGLALINGTSAMTGIAALNVRNSKVLLHYALLASSAMFEIVQASDDYFSKEISAVRPHEGQIKAGETFRAVLKSSKRISRDGEAGEPFAEISANLDIQDGEKNGGTVTMDRSRQEIYSIRCAVQVLGPMIDAVSNSEKVVEIEMNSVTDNPITFTDDKIVHGGNFHGDYVSYEMDKLKIAISKLSVFSERKLAFLLNDRVNKLLPPFLNMGTVGLDLGFQGLQFVATSTTAENQSLAAPVSIHSITCNNDNQDIVSMGTNSALSADRVISNAFEIMAIELAAIQRAVKILGIESKMSRGTRELCQSVASCVTSKGDLVKRGDIQGIIDMMKTSEHSLLK